MKYTNFSYLLSLFRTIFFGPLKLYTYIAYNAICFSSLLKELSGLFNVFPLSQISNQSHWHNIFEKNHELLGVYFNIHLNVKAIWSECHIHRTTNSTWQPWKHRDKWTIARNIYFILYNNEKLMKIKWNPRKIQRKLKEIDKVWRKKWRKK